MISGSDINTYGFPPNLISLAYISPNDLDTDNFPGRILCGPKTVSSSAPACVYPN